MSGDRHFYHYDPLGSTTALTDASGVLRAAYSYGAFGEPVGTIGSVENQFGYVGQLGVTREGSGLYFMRARYYDASNGSFLSRDPVAGAPEATSTLNAYIYAVNNPLVRIDANGEIADVLFVGYLVYQGVNTLWDVGAYAKSSAEAFMRNGWSGVFEETSRFAEDGARELLLGPGAEIYKATSMSDPCDTPELVCHLIRGVTGIFNPISSIRLKAPRIEVGLTKASGGSTLPGGGPQRPSAPSGNVTPAGSGTVAKEAQGKGLPSAKEPPPPRQYLNVVGYARGEFAQEYRHILAPNFLDKQTRSRIELGIAHQIAYLQQHRTYGYRTPAGKRRAMERRARDVDAAMGQLYAQLTAALSKHEVLIRDLSQLPQGATGGIATAGVYAGGN